MLIANWRAALSGPSAGMRVAVGQSEHWYMAFVELEIKMLWHFISEYIQS